MSLYTTLHATPSVDTYRHLRVASGLSPKSAEAAARGLPNSLFAVQILHAGEPIGMGRVIGDGGSAFQVVDIAVLPEHQGQGLGKLIMGEIAAWLRSNVPESGYVSLLADVPADALYVQFGFVHTAPATVGMAWKRA
ncbi:GNAT superfamily N-acetyltransferase [Pelomonas saccharophila]|uniref:GNAT superfamily N-acetyltransferase n=1 Tax=Roseateles saccharophilus TaxID=304 RepID=A0ABU1YVJ1_ROSSA|nr:GNAT family N-acetyltransferase [Roseateles saccharophilus]MDR7272873.1 GNAT superfamily N-acetyltransferase [Roseateles saccharophilus]